MKQFQAQQYPIELTEEDIREYAHKGKFLRADVLLLLRYAKQWRILCIDVSIFALRSLADASDLSSIDRIQHFLATELRYLRSKSVFTHLDIDTNEETTSSEVLSGKFHHYFTAFKRKDKESVKLIQAASYATAFTDFSSSDNFRQQQDEDNR